MLTRTPVSRRCATRRIEGPGQLLLWSIPFFGQGIFSSSRLMHEAKKGEPKSEDLDGPSQGSGVQCI